MNTEVNTRIYRYNQSSLKSRKTTHITREIAKGIAFAQLASVFEGENTVHKSHDLILGKQTSRKNHAELALAYTDFLHEMIL